MPGIQEICHPPSMTASQVRGNEGDLAGGQTISLSHVFTMVLSIYPQLRVLKRETSPALKCGDDVVPVQWVSHFSGEP